MVDHENIAAGLIMTIIGILFIILLGTIIFKLYKDSEKSEIKETETKAIEIAKERYAKGEINQDEFNQLKKDLTE
ncbi:electron transporter RnfE [Candidatus Saccharibacteria bacterium HGW-Saccharibacteria-1]|nr:MAG: electron transporter RnfE [Candidatus Saccharibacteria bacterium HGW-Saccharibacteria-1]